MDAAIQSPSQRPHFPLMRYVVQFLPWRIFHPYMLHFFAFHPPILPPSCLPHEPPIIPFCSHGQSDLSKQRLSLNLTPKLLSRWFGRHNSTVQERSMVYFPLATTVNVTETEMLVRYGADYHVHTHSHTVELSYPSSPSTHTHKGLLEQFPSFVKSLPCHLLLQRLCT